MVKLNQSDASLALALHAARESAPARLLADLEGRQRAARERFLRLSRHVWSVYSAVEKRHRARGGQDRELAGAREARDKALTRLRISLERALAEKPPVDRLPELFLRGRGRARPDPAPGLRRRTNGRHHANGPPHLDHEDEEP